MCVGVADMKKRQLKLVLSIIAALMILGLDYANRQGWLVDVRQQPLALLPGTYRVTAFHDGDTISVDMQGHEERIRFIGVDTPETQDPRKAVQCFGKAASSFTQELIGNNPVRLEADPINSNRDRYDRLLRYVYLPDGRLVQAELVKQGYGFAYTAFPFTKSAEFSAYQREAREQNRGLWSECTVEVQDNGATKTNDAIY